MLAQTWQCRPAPLAPGSRDPATGSGTELCPFSAPPDNPSHSLAGGCQGSVAPGVHVACPAFLNKAGPRAGLMPFCVWVGQTPVAYSLRSQPPPPAGKTVSECCHLHVCLRTKWGQARWPGFSHNSEWRKLLNCHPSSSPPSQGYVRSSAQCM